MANKRLESLVQQIEGRCHHFNGSQNECCKAGIKYADIGGPIDGRALRLPCLSPDTFQKRRMELGYTLAECSRLQRVTREEAEKEAQHVIGRGDRTMKAMDAAYQDAKAKGFRKGSGGTGLIPCPICGGNLRYSVASYNGHMHGKCEADGCVAWMQ
jgi:hypothetical protein